jgi:hypothetical protein
MVCFDRSENDEDDKPTYKIIFDNGKPYEVIAKGDEELKDELDKFYQLNRDGEYLFDVQVFYEDKDISESQMIKEMIEEIVGEN